MVIRWTRSTRKHRIGRVHVRYVMATVIGARSTTHRGGAAITWVGPDDRGLELEVVALIEGEDLRVIHVMPTALRRN